MVRFYIASPVSERFPPGGTDPLSTPVYVECNEQGEKQGRTCQNERKRSAGHGANSKRTFLQKLRPYEHVKVGQKSQQTREQEYNKIRAGDGLLRYNPQAIEQNRGSALTCKGNGKFEDGHWINVSKGDSIDVEPSLEHFESNAALRHGSSGFTDFGAPVFDFFLDGIPDCAGF